MPKSRAAIAALLVLAALTVAGPAFAHVDGGIADGLASGLRHPISGLDHVVAMLAVGLWGTLLGRPAVWLLPVVFPLVMAFGGALGIAGVPLPSVEAGIALSAIVLGLCVATALRAPLGVAVVLVGLFAIFHGYAHGVELPGSASPYAYAAGFVVATGLLHLAGIVVGSAARWPAGRLAVRAGGGAIALAGLVFLIRLA